MRKPRISKPYRFFGQWAVTAYGIECTTESYALTIAQIRESAQPGAYTLVQHMSEKNWVNLTEFRQAYEFAVGFFFPDGPARPSYLDPVS